MKIKYLLLFGAIVAFGSCSTAYRSGQTPDDVYYSPAPQQDSYVTSPGSKEEDSYYYRNNEEDYNIRRGIENPVYRNQMSLNLGFGYSPYFYNPYSYFPYNNYYGYNNFGYGLYGKGLYNPYFDNFGYNSFSFYSPYNFYSPYSMGYGFSPFGYGYGFGSPYYSPFLFSSKSVNTNTGARRYNLNAYNNNALGTRGEGGTVQPIRNNIDGTTPSSGNTGIGRVIRRVFTPSERSSYSPPANSTRREVRRSGNNNRSSYYNNNTERRSYNNNTERRSDNYEAPQRTFSPSTPSNSSSSSSSSSGGGGSAPVRTFRR